MPRMMRCKAQVEVTGTKEHKFPAVTLQPGMEVDLDRELYPGFTLGQAVSEDHFEPIMPDLSDAMRDPHAPPAAKRVIAPVTNQEG